MVNSFYSKYFIRQRIEYLLYMLPHTPPTVLPGGNKHTHSKHKGQESGFMALVSTFTAESCLGFTDVAGVVNHVALSSRPPPQRVDVRQGRLR